MCDTAVALPSVTKDKKIYFAKNSDRDPNESHYLEIIPWATHPEKAMVECTHFSIPHVRQTHAVLLAKLFWIWGAEMGVNEYGVAIGNEAIFSKIPAEKEPGLIGMDFLRLALERSDSSEQALHVIIELLEKYGQSGNCGIENEIPFNNNKPGSRYDKESIWWQHELLHREILKDYSHRMDFMRDKRNHLEKELVNQALTAVQSSAKRKVGITKNAFNDSISCEKNWLKKLGNEKIRKRCTLRYLYEWARHNRKAMLKV